MSSRPQLRVGVIFAAFPDDHLPAFHYFVLLLNRLQKTCEFELFDPPERDTYLSLLEASPVDATRARNGLPAFGDRARERIRESIEQVELAEGEPDQLIIITAVTLSDYHYLIRRGRTTLLALGEWDKGMAPPSLAEFLQLALLRAAYTALEKGAWESIHLGSRACIFDYTENLEFTRLAALTGVGVCADCERALVRDDFTHAPTEIRFVASGSWRGERRTPGTPASVMARRGYDLFLTKGISPTLRERFWRAISDEGVRRVVELLFAVALAWLLYKAGWSDK